MAGEDFRIDLLMKAHFEEAKAALGEAKEKVESIGETMERVNAHGVSLSGVLKGVAVGATAVATAAIAFMGEYIAKTVELEKVQAQLGARLKDTGEVAGRSLEQLNAQAEQLEHVTVFDGKAVNAVQAMLLTFTQIRGVNFDRTVKSALDLATVMGTDATEAAKLLGKALSDPEKGLGALRKAGVTFTAAQTEQIKAMAEAGKLAEAQAFMLNALEGRMGSAATAARNTLGGALQSLKNSFEKLLEGDSGSEGIVGTRNAIEQLIKTLDDPSVKRGVDHTVTELFRIVDAAVKIVAKLGEAASALREFYGDADKRSTTMLQNQRNDLEGKLAAAQRQSRDGRNPNGLLANVPLVGPGLAAIGAAAQLADAQHIADVQKQITEIDRILAQRARDELRPRNAASGSPAASNPKPEGEGQGDGTTKPAKSTADADADIKRRIAGLQEETALLGQIKDGEDKASEAAKARYAVTEGEFKNKSPQLKAELVAAAEALDKKKADIEAEKQRKKAIEDSKKAYDELLKGLRTPAEVAVDDAIDKLNKLNDAMQKGIATKTDYDKVQARIAQNLIGAQPDFQGLAPEVGGAYGELSKLDKAAEDEKQWYQDSLKRLEEFRAQKGAEEAAANAEEERVNAEHQQRMRQIEQARQAASLTMASDFFGQIAQLQHSQNAKAAAIGKAAAIAQAIINTYKSATEAYSAMAGIPYVGPALGVAAAAAAVAAGLANVAQIRAQPTGYSEGGYTGPGGKFEPAGIVHKGEGVLNQEEIAKLGGPSGFHALRDAIETGELRQRMYAWAGYADGGLVGSPRPTFASPMPPPGGANGPTVNNRMRVYLSMSEDQLVEQLLSHPKAEKKIVAIAAQNGRAITAEW